MAIIYILVGFGLGYLIGKHYKPNKLWVKILFSIGLPILIYGFVLLMVGAIYQWNTYIMGAKSATIFLGSIALMISLLIFVRTNKTKATNSEQNIPEVNKAFEETNTPVIDNTEPSTKVEATIDNTAINERELRKDKISGYISIGVVVLIFATFIGIRLYTNHLEKKNYEALSQIVQKDPDILNDNDKTTSKTNADIWQTYSNELISFKYPSTYGITDETEEDGLYQLTCEIKGSDISMLHFTYAKNPIFTLLNDEDKKQSCISGLSDSKEDLRTYFSKLTTSSINKSTKSNFEGYSFSYNASLFSIPIQGEAFLAYSGNYMIVLITQAENDDYQKQLNKIIETIKFK